MALVVYVDIFCLSLLNAVWLHFLASIYIWLQMLWQNGKVVITNMLHETIKELHVLPYVSFYKYNIPMIECNVRVYCMRMSILIQIAFKSGVLLFLTKAVD